MNKNHPDQSFKAANLNVDSSSPGTAEVKAELAIEELLNADDLAHIVGGSDQSPGHLEHPVVLPPDDRDNGPFKPSPTYPPLPIVGIPPSHSSKE